MTGAEIDYDGRRPGTRAEPAEVVTYVDAHDNETLFDTLALKLPVATSMADRVRMNTVCLATVALGQGPMFWHAGTDLLRSKSLDRNSFNSGDWFNRIDWTGDLDRVRLRVAARARTTRRNGRCMRSLLANPGCVRARRTWPRPERRRSTCCGSVSPHRFSGWARRQR